MHDTAVDASPASDDRKSTLQVAPPDRLYHQYYDARASAVIVHSALDDLELGGPPGIVFDSRNAVRLGITPNTNYFIYANCVTLVGDVTMHAGIIRIVARHIRIRPRIGATKVTVSVDGEPGRDALSKTGARNVRIDSARASNFGYDPNEKHDHLRGRIVGSAARSGQKPAKPDSPAARARAGNDTAALNNLPTAGSSAGEIVLVAADFDFPESVGLTLTSVGGSGGAGGDGLPGYWAQDGGNGAQCSVITWGQNKVGYSVHHNFNWVKDRGFHFGGVGGEGGDGGDAGMGAPGGGGGRVFVATTAEKVDDRITLRVGRGADGRNGMPGVPGRQGGGGKTPHGNDRSNEGQKYWNNHAKVNFGVSELPGSYFDPCTWKDSFNAAIENVKSVDFEAAAGAWGKHGCVEQNKDAPPVTDGSEASRATLTAEGFAKFADALFFSMMLKRADHAFMSGHPDFNPDPLDEAADLYAWLKATLVWAKAETDPELEEIRSAASIRSMRLNAKVDFWGHPRSWVPAVSFDGYAGYIQKQWEAFNAAETLYNEYVSAIRADLANSTAVSIALGNAARKRDELSASLKHLRSTKLTAAATSVADTRAALGPLKGAVASGLQTLKDKIHDHFECPTLEDVISALEMMVFVPAVKPTKTGAAMNAPGTVMAGAQITKLFTQHIGEIKVGNSYVGKDSLITEIVEAGSTLAEITAARADSKKWTETIPDAHFKLLARLSDVEKIIDDVQPKLKFGKEVRASIDALIAGIEQHNNAVMGLNEIVRSILSLEVEIDDLKRSDDRLHESIAEKTPIITEGFMFMRAAYERARQNFVEHLVDFVKALRYDDLLDFDKTRELFSMLAIGQMAALTADHASGARAGQQALWTVIDTRLRSDEHLGGRRLPFDERVVTIDDEAKIKSFQLGNPISFTLVAPHVKPRAGQIVATEFRDFFDVRVATARIFLEGARPRVGTTGAQVGLLLLREADTGERIYSGTYDERSEHYFVHVGGVFAFIYSIDASGNPDLTTRPAESARPRGGSAGYFARMSPFCEWHLSLMPDRAADIIVEGVKKITIHFTGEWRPTGNSR